MSRPATFPDRAVMHQEITLWADRFWNPIFQERDVTPNDLHRESSRNLAFRALLLLSEEGATVIDDRVLARAIHRVSQMDQAQEVGQ